jgi:hypothetical protein
MERLSGMPPPISGGTLIVLEDGVTAVAADPDEDRVWKVDLTHQKVVGDVLLQPGDEPGRPVEDAAGRIHVALRRGGALASIDLTGNVTRRPVCSAPRGLAYDASQDVIHVACADGTLATFPAAGGDAVRTLHLDRDLRDVVLANGRLYVSRFRAAEILEVAEDGTIAQRITLPSATFPSMSTSAVNGMITAVPSVAYRTIALPDGRLAMLHQRAQAGSISTKPDGYTDLGMCGAGVVHDAITLITPGAAPSVATPLSFISLAVDMAVSPDGSQIAFAPPVEDGTNLGVFDTATLEVPFGGTSPCSFPFAFEWFGIGRTIAVAFDGQGRVIVQTRDPATIHIASPTDQIIPLSPGIHDEGLDVFYKATGAGIVCASCHPEGGDDGRPWFFDGLGPRRTQNLRGGVLARAPFHWSGDIADIDALVTEVFEGRMKGPTLTSQQINALAQWMNALPALAPPKPAAPETVTRGRKIFEDPNVGCTACHDGPQLSNHALVNVGTGGVFKVPSLVAVGYRAPYLHDGCAATLAARFVGACGGGEQHGHTQQLDAQQLADLVAYLESL